MSNLILLFFLHNAFAAETKPICANLFFDKARIQKILSEEHGFSAEALDQAAFVEAELEISNRRKRQPIVFVHAPGEKLRTFKPSSEGGEFYAGTNYTHFIYVSDQKVAILNPDGWKVLSGLKQRDPALKAFFQKHKGEFEALSARWAYDTRRMEAARVFEGDGFSLLQIYSSPFGRTQQHLWYVRDGEPFRYIEHLFADEDGESAFALEDDLFIFRLRDTETNQFKYRVVPSIARSLKQVKDPKVAELIQSYPAQLTRIIHDSAEHFVTSVLNARVMPGHFVDEASNEKITVFLLESGDKRYGSKLLVLDPSLGVGGQEKGFDRVRHLELDDGRSLNVMRQHGHWAFQDVTGRGKAKELEQILNSPLDEAYLKSIKAKLL